MKRYFKDRAAGLESPPFGGAAITPSDGADLPTAIRCLNVGVSGTIYVTTIDGSELMLHVAAGIVFPIRATRIWATGTTALNTVGLY